MVDGDALEMRFGETQRGFESPPLRFYFYLCFFGFQVYLGKLVFWNTLFIPKIRVFELN